MTLSRRTTVPALLLSLGLGLAACAGAEPDGAAGSAAQGGSPAAASPSAPASPEFDMTDVRFTTMMLPHHMQAARMSELEIEKGADPEVVALAEQILAAQLEEIQTMQGFLAEFGTEPMPAAADLQGRWDMNFQDLQEAPAGEQADVVFLTNMMPHHAAAVPMSQNEIDLGQYEPAQELAQQIKKAQLEEIKTMKMMLRMRG